MSAEATGWVWKHSPYSGAQLLVHLAIADVVNDTHDNEFWMSRSALAEKARVARSTVNETLSDMVERGLLLMLESGAEQRRPSRFQFVMSTARPTTDLDPERALGRPPSVTRPTSGPALDRSPVITRPIDGESLGRSPAANPKEITQEPKRGFSTAADPNCIRCRGEGQIWSAGAGAQMPCSCTADRQLASVAEIGARR